MQRRWLGFASALAMVVGACDADSGGHVSDDTVIGDTADTDVKDLPALEGTVAATFEVRPGVETATVFDAAAGTPLTLYNAAGQGIVTVLADDFGQAHFAYIPATHQVLDLSESGTLLVEGATVLAAADDYVIRDDSVDPPAASAPFRVLDVHDTPDPSFYDDQPPLNAIHYGLFGLEGDEVNEDGFNYIEMRDGTRLGAMVRLPDSRIWGDGPYPTVVEYSGYAPSRPSSPDAGSRIITLLGVASVGVNMRGTGCSGGVFDIFNPAQHADGYDVVEVVARQPWVLHNKVGMVGLSYPGITQLYVARTQPPSLAAIAPMSVIGDSWEMLWPGGIYNDGFTRQWLEQRDADAAPNGQSWTAQLIDAGDDLCAAHQELRHQNIAFETFFQLLEFYPPSAKARSLPELVSEITVPVFLTGAWQDEQTGATFTQMLDHFTGTDQKRFTLFNGRHPDGYSPLTMTRWWEFVELYVGQRVPRMPGFVRDLAGPEIAKEWHVEGLGFEPDRFAGLDADDHAGALALYESGPTVRVLFENGAGHTDDNGTIDPGAPWFRFEMGFDTWPPAEATAWSWYLDANGTLASTAPTGAGEDSYTHDPDAGGETFFGSRGYQLLVPLWDIDWTRFPAGKSVVYMTPPLAEASLLAGPGYAELWLKSEASEVNLQVTLSEVRPDGNEVLVQSGWLRVGHGGASVASDRRVSYSFASQDFAPLVPGEWSLVRVPIWSVAHPLRAGSRLRVEIATPGRNHGTWEFDNPDYGGAEPTHTIGHGGERTSRLVLSVVDASAADIPDGVAPCPSLRGQPCRPAVPR